MPHLSSSAIPLRIEKPRLMLGFIPLVDCAPLVVAYERGYFGDEGLDVELVRETSWANIRDKVALGALDGAHMLAPMPLAASFGVMGPRKPMLAPCVLSLGGNAITVSRELYERMKEVAPEALTRRPCGAHALRRLLDAERGRRWPPLTFATVFPSSTHHYQLRYWLAAAGIDPDRDVRLVVVPPQQMVEQLASGAIAGYCVGEPWNSEAVRGGVGVSLVSSYEIWNNSMEKVLGVTEAWAERHPATLQAMVRALLRAARWLDEPGNRQEAAHLLAAAHYVDAPVDVVKAGLTGRFRYSREEPPRLLPDFTVFHRYAANFPWRSQGIWFARQMQSWGHVPADSDVAAAVVRTYRSDLYRKAALSLGMPVPLADAKDEGIHARPWTLHEATAPLVMGADLFFDGTRLLSPRSIAISGLPAEKFSPHP